MRKTIIVLLVALAACSVVLAGCSGKPSGMDEKAYNLAQQAITVGDDYVAGKALQADANAKLKDIYDELDAKVKSDSVKDLSVKNYVMSMQMYSDPTLYPGTSGESKFKENLQNLKGVCK